MEKSVFDKITKEVLVDYGFKKDRYSYLLLLEDVTIVLNLRSWNSIRSFEYYLSINKLYDSSTPLKKRADVIVETKMEHSTDKKGYHRHEIVYEEYSETEYRELLSFLIHKYFDPFKNNAIQFLKEDYEHRLILRENAKKFLDSI